MSRKSIQGNQQLAQAIRERRTALHMTIEEAADKAGVGTKTWCRYEAGEAIRQDKCKGVCKALNWRSFPTIEETDEWKFNLDEYRKSEYWSEYLEDTYGSTAAASFVIGSEILGDFIDQDLDELKKMPRGSHIGEIGCSFLEIDLPPQFLTRYDYEFVYVLGCSLEKMKDRVKHHLPPAADNILEELTLYLIVERSRILLEDGDYIPEEDWDEWVFDLIGDDDLLMFYYPDNYIIPESSLHFDHWIR